MKVTYTSSHSPNNNSETSHHADHCKNNWSFASEGDTKFLVPSQFILKKEPSKFPVFFNPAAKFNRDISIHIYRTFINNNPKKILPLLMQSYSTSCELLKKYQGSTEYFSMHSIPSHLAFLKSMPLLNNVYNKCNFYNKEICNFLSTEFNFEKRATIVDVDPFGTPAPYLDCLLRSVENGGLISVTATDTAVLCGVYPKVCYRKYYGNPLRTKYAGEIEIRLLISSIALIASRLNLSITPIFHMVTGTI